MSSSRPPTLPSTLMRSRLTSRRSRSATARTALTHISAMSRLHLPTILEESVVAQVATRGSMSLLAVEEASDALPWRPWRRPPGTTRTPRRPLQLRRRGPARGLVPLCDLQRVDPAVEQRLRLLEQRAGEHDDARRAVADLVVLRPRQVDQQAPDLVLHVHQLQDGRAVVGDGHVAVGDWSILSMPFGPSEVRSTRETALAAPMLALTASMPRTRDLRSCSWRERERERGSGERGSEGSVLESQGVE